MNQGEAARRRARTGSWRAVDVHDLDPVSHARRRRMLLESERGETMPTMRPAGTTVLEAAELAEQARRERI